MHHNIVVASDIEYTLALRDFAYEVLARILGEQGKKLYAVLSGFDDVLGLFPDALEDEELKKLAADYVPGTTPLLILPFLAAFCEFNGSIVEDLAEITDLRINRGVPDLVAGLQRQGIHVVLISSACDSFARRSAFVLNLPYYASASGRFEHLNSEQKRRLKDFALEIASCPLIEFKDSDLVRTPENLERIRKCEQLFKRFSDFVDLPVLVRGAMGGFRKVRALKHAVQYATGAFAHPVEPKWITRVMYLGDSITDEQVLREVSRKGGLAVSVNGNAFALAHADVAVVSKNLSFIQELAHLFAEKGKQKLLDHIAGNQDYFCEQGVFLNDHNPALRVLSNKMRAELKGEKAIIN